MTSSQPDPASDDAALDAVRRASLTRYADPDRTRSKIARIAGLCFLGVLTLGVLWILVTALVAKAKLESARDELPRLRGALLSGNVERAQSLAAQINDQVGDAHALTSGPAWWIGANLPWAGGPLRTARAISASTEQISQHVLPPLVELADTVQSRGLFADGTVDIAALNRIATVIDRAGTSTTEAAFTLRHSPTSSWLSYADSGRQSLMSELTRLQAQLGGAERTLRLAAPMLGQNGLRRYFVAFQNEAEARGLGGLPGAFAIVTAQDGRIQVEHVGVDSELDPIHPGLDLGSDYRARYGGADPTNVYVNSNISPDFRDAARIWASMWQKKSGERVDGAIAIDPTALSYLLGATGPARMPSGEQVNGSNVVALTQQKQYSRFSTTATRKAFIVAVSRAVSKRILASPDNALAVVHSMAKAAGQRRLVFWSSVASEERQLVQAGYAGILTSTSGHAFTGFVLNNAAGTKLDYYVHRTITYKRTSCVDNSPATATIALTNTAPKSGLPPYVTTRRDSRAAQSKPGDERLLVTYYGTPGSKITAVTVDGRPVAVSVLPERGLVTATIDLELPAGSTRTMKVQLSEPATDGQLDTLVQPAVHPAKVTTDMSCD